MHTNGHRLNTKPAFDSFVHPAIRATRTILDGSISAIPGVVEVDGVTYLTFNGMFVYFYHFDRTDTYNAVDKSHWNALVHDGSRMGDCGNVSPSFPPHPPFAPSAPLSPNQTHSPPSPIQPPAPPISPPPPSPPFSPPGPSSPPPSSPIPPVAPPPLNLTLGGLALNNTVNVGAWEFEVIILEDTATRIFFQPGFAFEPMDIVIFVPKEYTDAHPGGECGIASSLSTTSLEEENPDLSNADHGGYILLDDQGRMYVDVVLHNKNPASEDPIGDPLPILERSAAYFACVSKNPINFRRHRALQLAQWDDLDLYASGIPGMAEANREHYRKQFARQLTSVTNPFTPDPNQWIFLGQDIVHVRQTQHSNHLVSPSHTQSMC